MKLSRDNNPPQPEQTYTNTTHTSIHNLEPDTVYVFKVSAKTGCCVGLPASRQSTTPEGGMQLLFMQLCMGRHALL